MGLKKCLTSLSLLSLAANLSATELNVTSEKISENFVGNGAQWGGYEMVNSWFNEPTLNEKDWETLFKRIDYMRPPFLRIMTSPGWSYQNKDKSYDAESYRNTSLFKMLEYAQSRGIEITFGEWGHTFIGEDRLNVDQNWIEESVKFLNHLVETKGFTCIKTANIINEPNGDWSSANTSYETWLKVQQLYIAEMAKYPALKTMPLMGPDIALFKGGKKMARWIENAVNDLDANIGLYDVHIYPDHEFVHSGKYAEDMQIFRDSIPANKRIVLGEIGFKYGRKETDFRTRNMKALKNDSFASPDSNMLIYNAEYGIDMADAMIQSMQAGFSGALIWSMDDAMYNYNAKADNKQLKRWGFWNSLGEELCGKPEDENIRPFFYPVSLLCRYFPAGTSVYKVESLTDGVRAVWGECEGKQTIAIVNTTTAPQTMTLKAEELKNSTFAKYEFVATNEVEFEGKTNADGFAEPCEPAAEIDFANGTKIELKPQSFVLFTNVK